MARVYNISALLRRQIELQINHHYAEIEKSRLRIRGDIYPPWPQNSKLKT